MEIFIGSSREHLNTVRIVEAWLKDAGHDPLAWDETGLFAPGEYTFDELAIICQRVDAAVLIFGEDDQVWYRGDNGRQPRDNVLIEYGLFAGALGRRKAIVCRVGNPRVPQDLSGLTVIDASPQATRRAKAAMVQWARKLRVGDEDRPSLKVHDWRRTKLVGRWEGAFHEPDYPGGALSFEAEMDFESVKGPLLGRARLRTRLRGGHRGGPRSVDMSFDLIGAFRHSNFLKLEYQSRDAGVVQFGTMILTLNAEGSQLSGKFVGYGSVSEAIVSGVGVLTKKAPVGRRSQRAKPKRENGARSRSGGVRRKGSRADA